MKDKMIITLKITNPNNIKKLKIDIKKHDTEVELDEVTKALLYGMLHSEEFTKKLTNIVIEQEVE
jgi:hypothetical protein